MVAVKTDYACLVERWADTVLRVAVHNTACRADAEDVVQDVFEAVLRAAPVLNGPEHEKAYLIRATLNRCSSLHRAARQSELPLDETLPAEKAATPVLDAVRALPEKYRNALYLHYYEGYTAAEVGRILGCPAGTVLSLLSRGRKRLERELEGGDGFGLD